MMNRVKLFLCLYSLPLLLSYYHEKGFRHTSLIPKYVLQTFIKQLLKSLLFIITYYKFLSNILKLVAFFFFVSTQSRVVKLHIAFTCYKYFYWVILNLHWFLPINFLLDVFIRNISWRLLRFPAEHIVFSLAWFCMFFLELL